MRRNSLWKITPWLTIAMALLAAGHQHPGTIGMIMLVIGFVVGFSGFVHADFVFSGLPVEGRDIFLSRLFPAIVLTWLPAIVATSISYGKPDMEGTPQGLFLLQVAAIYTLMFLVSYSARIYAFNAPGWMRYSFVGWFALILYTDSLPVFPTIVTLLAASAFVFFRVWTTVPKSFQTAPKDASRDFSGGLRTPQFVYSPFLRFVFLGWEMALLVPIMFFFAMGHWWFRVYPFIFILVAWKQFHQRACWLRTLPISPSTLLLAFLLPIFSAIAAGYYFGAWANIPPLRTQIVSIVALSGITLIELLFCASMNSRSRFAPLPIFIVLLSIGWWSLEGGPAWAPLLKVAAHFSYSLLLAIGVAVLAILYLLLDRIFAESEFMKSPLALRN
jgi:hypothetical protein